MHHAPAGGRHGTLSILIQERQRSSSLKVILYYPRITPETHFPTWEPLQLIFLARALRDTGIQAEIIDSRLFGPGEGPAHLKEQITDDTLCVGLTALTCFQLIDALDTAAFLKNAFPHIPVIIGGWHASIFPEDTLKENGIDIVVRGQGEITLREIVSRLSEKQDLSGIAGVSWKKDGVVIHEKDRSLTGPDELPPLCTADFSRLDMRRYQAGNVLFYMSSVGCPYACSYCSMNSACGRKWLPLSAENVFSELRDLHKSFGFREVIFWDNVFFPSKKRVTDICRLFKQEGLSLTWSAHARINEIRTWDDDFLRQIRDGGCRSLFIGVESGSQRVLDRVNKGIKAEDIIPCFRKLKDTGIEVATNWLVGLPGENYEDVKKSAECIREGLKIYGYDISKFRTHVYRFMPFPGTPIYDALKDAEKNGLPQRPRDWGTYIHKKLGDGMEPWKEASSPSMFSSTTFYLWKAYLNQIPPVSLRGRVLKALARMRVERGFFRFPAEWLVWRKFGAK